MDLTVFVPNNAAFEAIGSAVGNLTMEQLAGILAYHGKLPPCQICTLLSTLTTAVVNGTVGYSSTLMNGSKLTAMNGEMLTITIDNSSVFVNSAKVVQADVLVANGVVHVIDK